MLRRLRYFWHQAWQSMRESVLVQLVAVSTIAVSLVVLGALLTLMLNVDRLAARWGAEARLSVFLADDPAATGPEAEAARLAALRDRIVAWPEVESVLTRSRADGLAALHASLGPDAPLLDGLGPELLPPTLEVTLRAAHRDAGTLAAIADRLRALGDRAGVGPVEEVAYGQDLLERLRGLRDVLRLSGLVIGGLVLLAVVFIVTNTVRLALFARRDEIEIMQLVGATAGFIRGPFYIEGGLQGLAGGAAALGLLRSAFLFFFPAGERVVRLELGQIPIEFLPSAAGAALVVGAGVVAVLASHFSVGRFLKAGGAGGL